MIKPAPDFKRCIQILLSGHGYEVTSNQIIRGKCVEHEVDAVARKNGETYIVEVKHHFRHHTPSGLDVSHIARAVFEDVTEGFKIELNTLKLAGDTKIGTLMIQKNMFLSLDLPLKIAVVKNDLSY